jgi:hypothetical protein
MNEANYLANLVPIPNPYIQHGPPAPVSILNPVVWTGGIFVVLSIVTALILLKKVRENG